MIKRHEWKAMSWAARRCPSLVAMFCLRTITTQGLMTRPMHANKTNVNATITLAGLTKCRQASAGMSPFDRAAACGGRAVVPGCHDGGLSCATPAAEIASILDLRMYCTLRRVFSLAA